MRKVIKITAIEVIFLEKERERERELKERGD